MKEMVTYLNCLALNHNNDDKYVRHKELLTTCMNGQVQFLVGLYFGALFYIFKILYYFDKCFS